MDMCCSTTDIYSPSDQYCMICAVTIRAVTTRAHRCMRISHGDHYLNPRDISDSSILKYVYIYIVGDNPHPPHHMWEM